MTETEGSLILKNFNFPEFGGYYKKNQIPAQHWKLIPI
jgi:hypothetical protein